MTDKEIKKSLARCAAFSIVIQTLKGLKTPLSNKSLGEEIKEVGREILKSPLNAAGVLPADIGMVLLAEESLKVSLSLHLMLLK